MASKNKKKTSTKVVAVDVKGKGRKDSEDIKSKVRKKLTEIRLEDPEDVAPRIFHRKTPVGGMIDLLTGMVAGIRKSSEIINERSKTRPVRLLSPSSLRRLQLPYEELTFQYMLGSMGFRTPMAIEIIAQESVGSTTWCIDFLGRLMDLGCYVIYCECEGKPMSDAQMKRILDRDPKLATIKLNAMGLTEARGLREFDEVMRKTVKEVRKNCDANPATKGNPIVFVADPWSALMSDGEAKGNSDWGMSPTDKKEQPKDSSDGSNFEHSKHAQRISRWLPSFMEEFNCTVVFVNKQNDKVDMAARPLPSYMQPSPSKNDTRIGGRALKRLCPYRITMMASDGGSVRDKTGDKAEVGYHVRLMAVKNSFGPRYRTCEFTVRHDKLHDRSGYQASPISYADKLASFMVKKGLLGVTVERELYTCDVLGCVAVSAQDLHAALYANPEQLKFLGGVLGIEGYPPTVNTMVGSPPTTAERGSSRKPAEEDNGSEEEPPEIPE